MTAINISHYHFFLGGHDAEMQEIKNVLSEHSCNIHDANLHWGAKLSAYKEEVCRLVPQEIPVLIELALDIEIPSNAIIIDHHDARAGADAKTAIEQVAALLGITLTRHQQLISSNDRGHIRAMVAAGASPDEIELIRKMDRDAQGISAEDYFFAEEALSGLRAPSPGVALVDSKTTRTAIIMDKLWNQYQSIIIKTPGEIHITGPGLLINSLVEYYKSFSHNHAAPVFWSGGFLPLSGFFGSTYFAEKEILNMAKELTSCISQHIFLFPFRIELWGEQSFSDDRLKDVLSVLTETAWEYKPFSPFKTTQDYNNYTYFHDYVRHAFFGKLKSAEIAHLFDENKKPVFVSCKLDRRSQRGTFELFIKSPQKAYKLAISEISLRILETGIAILAIGLENHSYVDFDDIQRINDFGRRIYPQFLGDHDKAEPEGEMTAVKKAFLADKIRIKLDEEIIEEDFSLENYMIPGHDHLHIGNHIVKLMGDDFSNAYKMEPIIDDRMFTICWYRGDETLKRLNERVAPEEPRRIFESDPDWYRFIFIDGGDCMCPDERLRNKLIEASTYRRFSDWGSLYGIARYSLVCMSSDQDLTPIHMRHQYRLMAEILLAQRASIITFNQRVADISKDIDTLGEKSRHAVCRTHKNAANIVKNIRKLNSDFLGFKNRLWFIEVTPQEQGIELYNLAMNVMGLEKDMAELKDEIKELYEYEEMQSNKAISDRAYLLTWLASIALPFTIVLAFWGMSFDFLENHLVAIGPATVSMWLLFALTLGGAFLAGWLIRCKTGR